MNSSDTAELLAELQRLGIKHTPENLVRIARRRDGTIVFLETGDDRAGLQHILKNHAGEFDDRGFLVEQIPDWIMIAVVQGRVIGIQGSSRLVHQLETNETIHYISIEISNNGYIVSANPTPERLIRRLTQEGK